MARSAAGTVAGMFDEGASKVPLGKFSRGARRGRVRGGARSSEWRNFPRRWHSALASSVSRRQRTLSLSAGTRASAAERTSLRWVRLRSRKALRHFFSPKKCWNLAAYTGLLYFYPIGLSLQCRFGANTSSCLFAIVSFAPFTTFKTFKLY